VIVVGARDRGKSTFCRLAIASLSRARRPVGLIDSDLGQKMIGPPLCVTFATADEDGTLALERLRFVGEMNPAANMAGVVASVARLAQAAAMERLIVNTSGLVRGPGLALKRWKIDALAPDLIIALAEGDELEPVLRPLPPGRVARLRPSASARRKSPALREAERTRALIDAFRAAQLHPLVGVPKEELEPHPSAEAIVRLCGLADRDGEDLGLGLVRGGANEEAVPVLTSVDPARVRRLRLGMAAPSRLLAALPDAGL
jgi:polynucleotide 5'-hydroxyl-kinase GRC3/NOL9